MVMSTPAVVPAFLAPACMATKNGLVESLVINETAIGPPAPGAAVPPGAAVAPRAAGAPRAAVAPRAEGAPRAAGPPPRNLQSLPPAAQAEPGGRPPGHTG